MAEVLSPNERTYSLWMIGLLALATLTVLFNEMNQKALAINPSLSGIETKTVEMSGGSWKCITKLNDKKSFEENFLADIFHQSVTLVLFHNETPDLADDLSANITDAPLKDKNKILRRMRVGDSKCSKVR